MTATIHTSKDRYRTRVTVKSPNGTIKVTKTRKSVKVSFEGSSSIVYRGATMLKPDNMVTEIIAWIATYTNIFHEFPKTKEVAHE